MRWGLSKLRPYPGVCGVLFLFLGRHVASRKREGWVGGGRGARSVSFCPLVCCLGAGCLWFLSGCFFAWGLWYKSNSPLPLVGLAALRV